MKRLEWLEKRALAFEARHEVLCDVLGILCILAICIVCAAVGVADGKIGW